MKKLSTLFAFIVGFVAFHAHAQTPALDWVYKVGYPSYNMNLSSLGHGLKSIAVDKDNNTFISGMTFNDSLIFAGPNGSEPQLLRGNMVYYAKFDAAGNLLWTKFFEGDVTTTHRMEPWNSTVDNQGNFYIVGGFRGTVDFDPGSGVSSRTATGATRDGFLIKLDNDGNYISGAVLPSSGNVYVTDVAVDNNGSPVICYMLETWNSGVVKFNPALTNAVFQKYYGSNTVSLRGVEIGANNDVFIGGYVTGFGGFEFGTEFITNNGNQAAFFAKYNSSGTEQFYRFINNGNSLNVNFSDMVVTSGNDVFVSGQIDKSTNGEIMNFDHTGATGNGSTVPFTGQYQNFLLKYNQAGSFEKVMVLPLASVYAADFFYNSLAKDAFDNVFMSAFFSTLNSTNVDFDPGSGTFDIAPGSNGSSFVLKVDSGFNFMGAGAIQTSNSWTSDIAVSKEGDVRISGIFFYGTDFDMSSGVYLDSAIGTGGNGFVAKYSLCMDSQSINDDVTLAGNTLTATQTGGLYQWLDCDNGNAPIAGANAQTFTPAVSGNYAVEVFLNGCSNASTCTAVTVTNIGIEETADLNELRMYPNPASDQVNLQYLPLGSKLSLVDLTGKSLFSTHVQTGNYSMDISSFAAGVYFVKIESEGSVLATRKLVINR